ncbi:MAG: hypothetical protein M0C28_43955 [Candidatus Moduliflexus flocculans]|nr:hypothetical protein [Candidatus Moduliflexus flocculans]
MAEAWDENLDDLDIVNGMVISYKKREGDPAQEPRDLRPAQARRQGLDGRPDHRDAATSCPPTSPAWTPRPGRASALWCTTPPARRRLNWKWTLDTGKIEMLKGVAAFDVGKAINPELVQGADGRRLCSGHELGPVREPAS